MLSTSLLYSPLERLLIIHQFPCHMHFNASRSIKFCDYCHVDRPLPHLWGTMSFLMWADIFVCSWLFHFLEVITLVWGQRSLPHHTDISTSAAVCSHKENLRTKHKLQSVNEDQNVCPKTTLTIVFFFFFNDVFLLILKFNLGRDLFSQIFNFQIPMNFFLCTQCVNRSSELFTRHSIHYPGSVEELTLLLFVQQFRTNHNVAQT